MKIRKAKVEDKKNLLKLVKQLYGKSAPKTVNEWKDKCYSFIKNTIVVEDKGELIAYICFKFNKESMYIGDLYVKPTYRRKGVATRLLKKVEHIQKETKKKYLRVDVRKKDSKARKLYKKLGFNFWKLKNKGSLKLRK